MKLKTRLIFSFCIVLILPIALAAGLGFGLYRLQMHALKENYGIEKEDVSFLFSNSIQMINRYTEEDYEDLQETASSDPEELEDLEYLDEKNMELQEKNSFLVVVTGGRLFFNGSDSEEYTNEDILAMLPEHGAPDEEESGYYLDDEEQWLIRQVDFTDSDGVTGSVYLITSTESLVPEMRQLLIELGICVLLILVLTAAIMTIWIYRGIINPIAKLKVATQNIKEGNLDFTIEANSDDEIGELCENFEEMRKRLKESTEERMNNEKENRELISNIAHDLKTPITTVKGYAEGILDGVADTPERKEKYVRTIYNKANEMDRLINELTIYSKIDTNRIPYNFQKLNVADFFNDCVEEVGLELETEGIGLSYYNYTDPKTVIIGDPEQLKRVISNIIGNSVKYMDKPHGLINIRIKDVGGDFIQVEIEDNGPGIAMKDIPYIFDRFYRSDASRNSGTGGSGIGLSIVKKIIEDHGGRIWATSKEKVGTIMYFVIRKYQEVPYSE